MNTEETNTLIDELLDGEISEADFIRLEAEFHVSKEARHRYYKRLQLHTVLQLETEGRELEKKTIAFPAWRTHTRWALGIAAAITVIFAGSLGWNIGKNGAPAEIAKSEPAAEGYGVVAEQSNAAWGDDCTLDRGDLVPECALKLKSGMVQLELFSGATVILEGEAEFQLLSSMEMSVAKGKMRALIPEHAKGFRVHTSAGEVVDLGTEFALNVTPEHADVHVLDGEVEWHPNSKPMQRLVDGDSIRWTAAGESATPPDQGQIPAIVDLEQHLTAQRDERRVDWSRHSAELRKDPRLLAYFPMDQPGEGARRLTDESSRNNNGTIVLASRVSDRWEKDNSALDFSPTGSRVRMNVPGEHRSLTFYCWAKIDSLDRWYNSLFLTDGHELHEPHWQIMDDGRLFFSVKAHEITENKKARSDKHVAFSPPIWTPADSGKWMQIATVYDGDAATTTHYVNGRQISRDQIPEDMRVNLVRIGAASIGNWSEPKRDAPHFAMRNLNGAIDEFAIFSGALSADEIQNFYEIGKP